MNRQRRQATGLHYNWHRSYDPSIGRYTQPDPLGFVDGPSVYGYARGFGLTTSSIVVFEFDSGGAGSRHRRINEQSLRGLIAALHEVLSFDSEEARAAGEIRASLRSAGTPIGPYDDLIEGQALRHGATLVTANVREFNRVPGLTVEDWA